MKTNKVLVIEVTGHAAILLLLALAPVAGCSDSVSSRASGGTDGGTLDGTNGGASGGPPAISCEVSGGSCSCRAQSIAAPSGSLACFADFCDPRASPRTYVAPRGSVSNGMVGPDYECTCAPPVATTWHCERSADGRSCSCRAQPTMSDAGGSGASSGPSGGTEIPPSECVSKVGNCAYTKGSESCDCTDRDDIIYPGLGVPNCAAPPGGRLPKLCSSGLAKVQACDGDCHAETCFGGAGEECNSYGCTPLTWQCIANVCQKI